MIIEKVWLDFETYSEVDIKKVGGWNYVNHDSTNVLCLGYALDDGAVQLWNPSNPTPDDLLEAIESGAKFYAQNAIFDFRVWNIICTRDFGWPKVLLNNVVDTMAIFASFSLPLSLEVAAAGEAMQIKSPKFTDGKKLIALLCSPDKNGMQPMPFDPKYRAAFERFFAYCKRDVKSMREICKALPRDFLIPQEHDIWKLTMNMNHTGLPVAYNEATDIRKVIDAYIKLRLPELSEITSGLVTTVNQHARIKKYCNDNGYPVANTQAGTITEALGDPKCTGNVRKVLQFRSELGSAATAKYKKLIELAAFNPKTNYHWLHDNLVYHGAGPGRWTAKGFQMQNLPRAKVKNPDEVIEMFRNANTEFYEYLETQKFKNPVQMGKALIRPMIKAPDGYQLLVSDYSSIENRGLAWLAMDEQTLIDFSNDIDQYITMASSRYGIPYEQILEDYLAGDDIASGMRFTGKVIILGCGYQMGAETYVKTAKEQFGLTITLEEGKADVSAYRTKYHLVKKLWKELQLAAVRAITTGERQTYGRITFGTSTIKGTRWLAMLLPSGKAIYYKNPKIRQQFIPKYEHMGKVPTVTAEGRHPYTRKWTRLPLTPGRITENATQGSAREFMGRGMLNVQERMPEAVLIGSVHDEAISLIREDDITNSTMDTYNRHLCDIPFAKGCPIKAVGYISKRYKKD